MYSLALRLVAPLVVPVKSVAAMAMGNFLLFFCASNIMNNFAFKAIFTFLPFHMQNR